MFVRLHRAAGSGGLVAKLAPLVLLGARPIAWRTHRTGNRITRTTGSTWALHDQDEMKTDPNYLPTADLIESTIDNLLARRRPDATVCPSEVARALASSDDWRSLRASVREAARSLAHAGRVVITQRGQVLLPDKPWRGAIRIGKPQAKADDGQATSADARVSDRITRPKA